jgi:hypothetical protein
MTEFEKDDIKETIQRKLENTEFQADFDISDVEKLNYIRLVEKDRDGSLSTVKCISVKLLDDQKVTIDLTLLPQKFERIRRITGYLVGDVTRWNNAKRAELHDRVTHGR